MDERLIRLACLLNPEEMDALAHAHVAVFGVGGVGGSAMEALARSGIGIIDVIDNDIVAPSNLNRQIIATEKTLGCSKVDAAVARIHDINPHIHASAHNCFYLPENSDMFDFHKYDYVLDCIDTVSAKLDLIVQCQKAGTPIVSAMGCGNRLDPSKLLVCDIYQTKGDPLAKVMRHELRKRGIKKLTVVYSTEEPIKPLLKLESENRRSTPGSSPFVPPAAGLLMASYVVRAIAQGDRK